MIENTYIKNFYVNSFRNLKENAIELVSHINLFFGDNGSGKTSLLESLYCLTTGKSFRTHIVPTLINHETDHFLLTAALHSNTTTEHFIAIERYRNGEKNTKLDYESIKSIAPITKLIPLQIIGVDSYRFFSDGPKERRAFLDWGLFHVKHEFLTLWQQFNKILKHRNAALKLKQSKGEIAAWDQQFIQLSEAMDHLRSDYLIEFQKIYITILRELLPNQQNDITIRYKRGWAENNVLKELLEKQFYRDLAFGHTQNGPHRADIQVFVADLPADDVLSQGQQKIAAYALHLAQGILLKTQTNQSAIYLIDDLPSELDKTRQMSVINMLKQLNSQIIITSILKEDVLELVERENSKLFHVEHGIVREVLR